MVKVTEDYISSDLTRHCAYYEDGAWYATLYPFPDTPLTQRQAQVAVYLAERIDQGITLQDPASASLRLFAEELGMSLEVVFSYMNESTFD